MDTASDAITPLPDAWLYLPDDAAAQPDDDHALERDLLALLRATLQPMRPDEVVTTGYAAPTELSRFAGVVAAVGNPHWIELKGGARRARAHEYTLAAFIPTDADRTLWLDLVSLPSGMDTGPLIREARRIAEQHGRRIEVTDRMGNDAVTLFDTQVRASFERIGRSTGTPLVRCGWDVGRALRTVLSDWLGFGTLQISAVEEDERTVAGRDGTPIEEVVRVEIDWRAPGQYEATILRGFVFEQEGDFCFTLGYVARPAWFSGEMTAQQRQAMVDAVHSVCPVWMRSGELGRQERADAALEGLVPVAFGGAADPG